MRISATAVLLGILAIAVAILSSISLLDSFQLLGNNVSEKNLCVSVGEPLYPGTSLVHIDDFRKAWASPPYSYQISVNEQTMKVTVRSPDGHVGAWNVGPNGLVLALVNC